MGIFFYPLFYDLPDLKHKSNKQEYQEEKKKTTLKDKKLSSIDKGD